MFYVGRLPVGESPARHRALHYSPCGPVIAIPAAYNANGIIGCWDAIYIQVSRYPKLQRNRSKYKVCKGIDLLEYRIVYYRFLFFR